MARTVAHAAKRGDDGGAGPRRSGDVFSAGLQTAIEDLLDELLEQAWENTPAPTTAAAPAQAAPQPGAVLRLPVRHADQLPLDEPPEVAPDVLTEAIAPLIEEVGRLRAEVARLREGEAPAPAVEAPSEGRAELVKLLAGVMVCFILVAIALVIVVKA
jgi:hypothetical protein